MKRKNLSLAIGCALMASAMVSPLAFAQESPDTQETKSTLDTVTVTARKREETLQEVPVAVTAFTAEALDRLNIEDLSDLDSQVPNLTIYAARGSSSTITGLGSRWKSRRRDAHGSRGRVPSETRRRTCGLGSFVHCSSLASVSRG